MQIFFQVLFLVQTSLHAKFNNLNVSPALAARINDMLAAAFFISFATTLVTTVLIAYRIHSVSQNQGASSRRFKHIIDIVVQSGAVYALSQFVAAVAGVVPGANAFTKSSIAFQAYTQILNFAIAVRVLSVRHACRTMPLTCMAGNFGHGDGRSSCFAFCGRHVSFYVRSFVRPAIRRAVHCPD